MRRRVPAAGVGVALALVVLLAFGATACNPNVNRRELVVVFDDTATQDQRAHVLQACDGAAPRTSPEPMPTGSTALDRVAGVRFRVDRASDRDVNTLLQCLLRQPGVKGYNLSDANG